MNSELSSSLQKGWRIDMLLLLNFWCTFHSFCPAFAERKQSTDEVVSQPEALRAWPWARADTPVSAMLQAGQQLCWRAEVARDKGWDEEGVIHQPHWRVLPLPSPAIQTEHITTTGYLQFHPCHILQRQWNGGAFHWALSWGGSRRTNPPSGSCSSWGHWGDGVLAGKGRGKEGTSMDGRSAQVHL